MKLSLESMCLNIVDCEHKTSPIDETGRFFAVGTPAMRGNVVNFEQARRISEDTFNQWTRRLRPKFGDLLFAREAPVGPVVLIPEEENVAPGQRTVLLRPDPKQLNSRFLYYFLSSPKQQRQIEALAAGSTVAHLNVADVRALQVQVPALVDQQAIAEVLGALDDKIAANVKLSETLSAMATAQFDFCAKSGKSSVLLSDLVTTQYGVTTSSHDGPGPQFLRVTDINKKPWIEWATAPFCTVSETELAKYKVNPGDILVARMADPGKAAYVDHGDPEAVFASYLVRLRAHDIRQALFIYYYLRSNTYRSYAEGAMQGSVQKNMNAKVIVATDISIPELEILNQFNNAASKLRAQIQTVLKENLKLAETRDVLLPQLMSGKLRVKDAEALVESVV